MPKSFRRHPLWKSEPKPLLPQKHQPDRHIIKEIKIGGRILRLHATKGWRNNKA